jgi:hypothetical protein
MRKVILFLVLLLVAAFSFALGIQRPRTLITTTIPATTRSSVPAVTLMW